ncbi:hypothetical protein [Limibacterium fermenti]|uniref:hypothetical protein n=1 Tax=Limibacterium fermenti TaxID=3229863 RepID=UPI003A69A472
MVDVFIDLSELEALGNRIEGLGLQPLLIDCASSTLATIKTRVFEKGLDSNGEQIGTYSAGYMKVRTGDYPETRLKRGKNKGEFRKEKTKEGQAGYFSRGGNKGQPRPRYNRTSDTKVVASLTREMENDMKVITGEKEVFIGFTDSHNYDKSQWVERTYDKDIWSLTVDEEAKTDELAEDFTDGMLG